MTDELLAEFRSRVPLPDEATAHETYRRTTTAHQRIRTRRAVAIGTAALCLAAGGTALAVTLTGPPSRSDPGPARHGHPGGQTGTDPTGTSTNCGIETQTYPQPPAGFDPTKATAAELAAYGFPPRPAGDPSGPLGAWLKAMAAWKTTDQAEPTCGTNGHPPPRRG
jgi:hypothetical protein